jgi:hypothetical protein
MESFIILWLYADKFHQHIIDTENYNTSSTNIPDASTVQVNQHENSKLSFYDPSDLLANNLEGILTNFQYFTKINIQFLSALIPTKVKLYISKTMKDCHIVFHLDRMRSYSLH